MIRTSLIAMAITVVTLIGASDCGSTSTGDRNERPPTSTSTEKPLQTGRQKP